MSKPFSSSFGRPLRNWNVDGAFVIVAVLLVSSFLLAGGARDDLASLIIWRPLSALLLSFAMVFYGAPAWRNGKLVLLFALAVVGAVLLHLIPLPPSIWSGLPGRKIVVGVYEAADMPLPWQPISIAQVRTWNALFSLLAPLGMLIALLALPARRNKQLLYLLIGLGFASGLIGMIQSIGPSSGPLYFYRITNNGLSVGFFANRNHQAAMLATIIPMIAASLSLFRGKPDRLLFHRSLSIALAGLVIPLILMTGSRMGVVLAAAGGVLALWVYRAPQSVGRVEGVRSEHRTRLVGLGVGGLLLVLVGVIAARSPALERLFGTDPASELRLQAFPVVLTDVWNYFPVGSGFGTFVETYQISEPASLISERYFNHAHNDFLELVLTGGLAGVLLLVWAVAMGAIAFRSLLRGRRTARDDPNFSPQVLGRTGFSILAIFALASLTDYPLRVPSLMLCAVVAVVWCLNAVKNTRDDA